MRAIILAFRGNDDFAPAIGKDNCIHEPELLKRLWVMFSCKPSNMTISHAISQIRDTMLTTPKKENGIAVWYINGEYQDGTPLKFQITPKDYIIGGEKGRFLPATAEEIKEYETARREDAKKQLRNANSASLASSYFLPSTPKLTFF